MAWDEADDQSIIAGQSHVGSQATKPERTVNALSRHCKQNHPEGFSVYFGFNGSFMAE